MNVGEVRKEMEAIRTYLENEAKVGSGIDIETMQNDTEMVTGYAERVASLRAEALEELAIQRADEYERILSDPRYSAKMRQAMVDRKVAGIVRLSAELEALGKRLSDVRWILMQACSIRKEELKRNM